MAHDDQWTNLAFATEMNQRAESNQALPAQVRVVFSVALPG